MGDININTKPRDPFTISDVIDIIHSNYSPANNFQEAKVAFTTGAIKAQIRAFSGLEVEEAHICSEMTARGYKVVYAESVELGLAQNFYWLLK